MRNISVEKIDINYFKVVKCIHHREGSEEHLTRENLLQLFQSCEMYTPQGGEKGTSPSREMTLTISKL